jgi:hypothetical protein
VSYLAKNEINEATNFFGLPISSIQTFGLYARKIKGCAIHS